MALGEEYEDCGVGPPQRPTGYVDPNWVSPMAGAFFPPEMLLRFSPYFEHTEYHIFVEAQPYVQLVAAHPDEERLYEQGYIWATSYSTQCVAGEGGHHHLSVLCPISPERFARARAAGWDL